MLGLSSSLRSSDQSSVPRTIQWYGAIFITLLLTVSVFYFVSRASGDRQERILDRGAYSDLRRIGREIDFRLTDLIADEDPEAVGNAEKAQPTLIELSPLGGFAANQGPDAEDQVVEAAPSQSIGRLRTFERAEKENDQPVASGQSELRRADAAACRESPNRQCGVVEVDNVSTGDGENESVEPDSPGDEMGAAQNCRSVVTAALNRPLLFGVCERGVQASQTYAALYWAICSEPSSDAAGGTLQATCQQEFQPGERPFALSSLGLERITDYAVYADDGQLLIQMDGAALMPAQLDLARLRMLSAEARSPDDKDGADEVEDDPVSYVDRRIRIGGESFRLYTVRLNNSRSLWFGSGECEQRECYIVGLAPARSFWDDILSVSPLTQLVFVAIVGILILSIPLLKLRTVGGNSAFTHTDIAVLAVAIPLGAATATLMLCSYLNWFLVSHDANGTIQTATHQIASNIESRLNGARRTRIETNLDGPPRWFDNDPSFVLIYGSGNATQVRYTDPRLRPSDQIINRDYVRSVLGRRDLWPCDTAPNSERPPGLLAWLLAQHPAQRPAQLPTELPQRYARPGVASANVVGLAADQLDRRCRQHAARVRVMPNDGIATGSIITILGVPALVAGGTEQAGSVESNAAAVSWHEAAIATPLVDEERQSLFAGPLAAVAPNFGFAVIDSRNGQVLHHHKPERDLLEFFSEEVDLYLGSWLDSLARSMPEQCSGLAEIGRGTSRRIIAPQPRRIFYEGRAIHVSAQPSCSTGWIVLAWWDEDAVQLHATDAALLGATIYLTFASILVIALIAIRAFHPAWFSAFCPLPGDPVRGCRREWLFIRRSLVGLAAGGFAFLFLIWLGAWPIVANICLWIGIGGGVLWWAVDALRLVEEAGAEDLRPGETVADPVDQVEEAFDEGRKYHRILTGAQALGIVLVSIVPAIAAYVSADIYRHSLIQRIDLGIAQEAQSQPLSPNFLILEEGLACLSTETGGDGDDPCSDSAAPALQNRAGFPFLGQIGDVVLPRISDQAALYQALATELPPIAAPDDRRRYVIAKIVAWLFVAVLFLAIIFYVVITIQRALFGLQHVRFPERPTDSDLVGMIGSSEQSRFLIIDSETWAREKLADDRERVGQVRWLDLSLDPPEMTATEEASLGRTIWFVTNIESMMSDPQLRSMSLEFLERLNARPEAEIFLFSEIPPLVRLRSERENLVKMVDMLREENPEAIEKLAAFDFEQFRWSNLLSDFQTVYCPARMLDKQEAEKFAEAGRRCRQARFVAEEAEAVRYKVARKQLLKLARDPEICSWTNEQVIMRLQAEMSEYYERQWRICSREEQLAMLNLAEGKFLNTANFNVVSQLLQRGLVVRRPTFTLKNRSFASWVRTTDKGKNFEEFRRVAEREGAWRLLRYPLLIAVIGSVSLLSYLTQENFEMMVALLPALLSGLPVLIATFLGGRPEVPR